MLQTVCFLLLVVLLRSGTSQNTTACAQEDCYRLAAGEAEQTQAQVNMTADELERVGLGVNAALEQLDNATRSTNRTLDSARQLNASESSLQRQLTSLRARLVASQQQLMVIGSDLDDISATTSSARAIADDAATAVEDITTSITQSVAILDQFEADTLTQLENLTTMVSRQSDNGTALSAQLENELLLARNQSLELLDISSTIQDTLDLVAQSLAATMGSQLMINSTVFDLSYAMQNISTRLVTYEMTLMQTELSLQAIDADLTVEEGIEFTVVSMEAVERAISEAEQLVANLTSLSSRTDALIAMANRLFGTLQDEQSSLVIISNGVQSVVSAATNVSTRISSCALVIDAVNDANALIEEAFTLLNALNNFTDVTRRVNESLQGAQDIREMALQTSINANNTAMMLTQVSTTVNGTAELTAEASDLSQAIAMTLELLEAEISIISQNMTANSNAVNTSVASLRMAQDTAEDISSNSVMQRDEIDTTEAIVGQRQTDVAQVEEQCSYASDTFNQLQSDLDNLDYLSDSDVAAVRDRLMSIAVQLTEEDLENVVQLLTVELDRQRMATDGLESRLADIDSEVELLRQIHDALPQSCN